VDPPQDPEAVDEFFASEEEATDDPEDVVVSDNTGERRSCGGLSCWPATWDRSAHGARSKARIWIVRRSCRYL